MSNQTNKEKHGKKYSVIITTGSGQKVEIICSKNLGSFNVEFCKSQHPAWSGGLQKTNNKNNKKDIYANVFDDLLKL